MNILVFSWRDPKHPMSGGAEQVMHEHMKGWTEAGHSVTLFCSYYKGGKRNEVLDGINIIRYGYQLLGVQILAFFWYLFGSHKKFDLVVDQFHGIPFFTPLYVRRKKLAIIQEVARDVWLLNHLPKPFNWIVGYLGFWGEKYIFKFFYQKVLFMTGSESANREVIEMGIKKEMIKIVPHGTILELPKKLPNKEDVWTIAFLGALTKDKGIEDALRAFSLLKREGDFQFWVIGKAGKGYDLELFDLVNKLNILDKVKFWGFVEQKKKFDLLARSHVLINPSVREGWGLVNIEANAVGVPVIAYNSPGLVDSIKPGKNGVLVSKNTPEELANETIKLLNDNVWYKKLCKSSITWSKEFTWEKSKLKSLQLIESIL